jgi:uncharacterized membrane protein YsdA (DUF1294 family)
MNKIKQDSANLTHFVVVGSFFAIYVMPLFRIRGEKFKFNLIVNLIIISQLTHLDNKLVTTEITVKL